MPLIGKHIELEAKPLLNQMISYYDAWHLIRRNLITAPFNVFGSLNVFFSNVALRFSLVESHSLSLKIIAFATRVTVEFGWFLNENEQDVEKQEKQQISTEKSVPRWPWRPSTWENNTILPETWKTNRRLRSPEKISRRNKSNLSIEHCWSELTLMTA